MGACHPQRKDAGDGYRHDHDDERVAQGTQEHAVVEQIDVVLEADKDVGTVHGGIKEAGEYAHHHGVDDEADKEHQTGQQEQITGDGLLPDKRTAHLRLALFGGCVCQEDRSLLNLKFTGEFQ